MKIITTLAAATLTVTMGCAKGPDAIAPVAIASAEYAGQSCQSLTRIYASVTSNLSTVEAKQRSAQTADAIGVFLFLIPFSQISGGDNEGNVALYKGEKLAVERAMQKSGC